MGDGLIEGTSRPRGGRKRTEYRLTPAGRDALHAWLRESEAGYEMRDEGLLKLFFAGALEGDEALDVVRAFRIDREGCSSSCVRFSARRRRRLEASRVWRSSTASACTNGSSGGASRSRSG